MDLILAILCTIGISSIIMLIRNQIVYKIQMKALKETTTLAKKAIAEGKNWKRYYDYHDRTTYNQCMFDLTKWTYKQFRDDLVLKD